MAIQTDSSRFGLIEEAWSMISWAAYSLSVAAVLEYSSFRSRTASRQSSVAVRFEITSAQPDARRRNGAWTISWVSAITPIGTAPSVLVMLVAPWSEARGDEMPS